VGSGFDGMVAACPSCATRLDPDAARCWSCGTDLRGALVVLVPEAPPLPPRVRHPVNLVLAVLAVVVLAVLVGDGMAAARLRPGGCQPHGVGAGAVPLVGQCTGTLLVLQTPDGIQTLDLDRGRVESVNIAVWAGVAPLAPSAGRVPVVGASGALAVPVDGEASLALGPAELVVSDGDRGWWLVSAASSQTHGLASTMARRARGSGVVYGRPILLGSGVTPVAGVAGGLLVTGTGGRLSLIGGAHPGPVAGDLGAVDALAAAGNRVLLGASPPGRPAGLWLVDVASRRETFVGSAGRTTPAVGGSPEAKFSPDGHWLAVFVPYAGPHPQMSAQLVLVDLRRGKVSAVPGGGTAAAETAVAWSPNSQWLFFLQAGGPVNRTIGSYHLGDRTAGVLNYFPGPVTDLAGVAN